MNVTLALGAACPSALARTIMFESSKNVCTRKFRCIICKLASGLKLLKLHFVVGVDATFSNNEKSKQLWSMEIRRTKTRHE